jgi:putative tricarboxylic transport membrane protein
MKMDHAGAAGAARLALAALLWAATTPAMAWSPQKPVQVIVNVGPGGGTDLVARTIQHIAQELPDLKLTMTVVNKKGGGGSIGVDYVSRASADGEVIGMSSNTLLTTPILGTGGVDFKSLTPLAMLSQSYVGFAVAASSSIKTPQDLLDKLKSDPGSLTFAIGGGVGNENHIAISEVAESIGIDPRKLKTVVLASGGESTEAVLGGHIDVGMTSIQNFLPFAQSGTMRILAVASPKRLEGPILSDVPTWSELGINSIAGNWYTVYGPPNMPKDRVDYWNKSLGEIVATQEWKDYLASNKVADIYTNSTGTAAFLEKENAQLTMTLKNLGLAK